MEIAIVIPARWGSKRLPGKPLMPIAGRSLIERVWRIARAVEGVAAVQVATDDPRIAEHVEGFGGTAVMTPEDCANGTERVCAALGLMTRRPDAAINLQGDAVLTPPWVIQALVDELRTEPGLPLVTPAVQCDRARLDEIKAAKATSPSSGTLVVFDRRRNALYFSKAVIPFLRDPGTGSLPVWRHIGLYGYSAETLETLASLPPTPLETAEQLEQLRALEHGIPIRVVPVDYRGRTHWSVDSAADIVQAEAIIAREGELV